MEHRSSARQIFDNISKMSHGDADDKECKTIPAVSTIGSIPTLSDLPCTLSSILATSYPDDDHCLDDKDASLHVTDDMNEIEEYEHGLVPQCVKDPSLLSASGHEIDEYVHFLAPECSSDEGRRCDISYTDCFEDLLSDPFLSNLNDHLLNECDPEPVPKKCSLLWGLHHNTVHNEVAKVQKRVWKLGTRSSGDEEEEIVLFCNRRLKRVKAKQDEEEDLDVQLLAEVSIMTQIAQHADQAQDLFMPSLKGFGQQVSAGPSLGCKVAAPSGDLNFDHGSGLQVTSPFSSHSKSPTSKHRSVDLSDPVEAVEMD